MGFFGNFLFFVLFVLCLIVRPALSSFLLIWGNLLLSSCSRCQFVVRQDWRTHFADILSKFTGLLQLRVLWFVSFSLCSKMSQITRKNIKPSQLFCLPSLIEGWTNDGKNHSGGIIVVTVDWNGTDPYGCDFEEEILKMKIETRLSVPYVLCRENGE